MPDNMRISGAGAEVVLRPDRGVAVPVRTAALGAEVVVRPGGLAIVRASGLGAEVVVSTVVGPRRPTVESVDVLAPTVIEVRGSEYESIATPPTPHAASRVQIARGSDPFSSSEIDQIFEEPRTILVVLGLEPGESYRVRIAYRDAEDFWSLWSDPFPVSLPEVDRPLAPTLTLLANDPGLIEIRSSAYQHEATEDVPEHAGTRWRVTSAGETVEFDGIDDTGPVQLRRLILGDVPPGVSVTVRARYIDDRGVSGPESAPLSFTSNEIDPDAPDAPTVTVESVGPTPEASFLSSEYSSPVGSPQARAQWELYKVKDDLVRYDQRISTLPEVWERWVTGGAYPGTYVVRKRDQDEEGRWGEWSDFVQFQAAPGLFPPVIRNLTGGDVLSGTVLLEWRPVPDDEEFFGDILWWAYYSTNLGATWEPIIEETLATQVEWDTTPLGDRQVVLVQIRKLYQAVGPAGSRFASPTTVPVRLDQGTGFAFVADQDDPSLWTPIWSQSAEGDWTWEAQRRLFHVNERRLVEPSIPLFIAERTGLAYTALGEPDGLDLIGTFRLASRSPPPGSIVVDAYKYWHRETWAGFMIAGNGQFAATEPYSPSTLPPQGCTGFLARVRPSSAIPPYGRKFCNLRLGPTCIPFPFWNAGIWETPERVRGRANLRLIVRLDMPNRSRRQRIVDVPGDLFGWVPVYEADYEMGCVTCQGETVILENDRGEQGPFPPSAPVSIRMRMETVQIYPNGNRDLRVQVAVYGEGQDVPEGGWHVNEVFENVGFECGFPAFFAQQFHQWGQSEAQFERMSLIPLSYGDCVQPIEPPPPPPPPEFLLCPPFGFEPVRQELTLFGGAGDGSLYLFDPVNLDGQDEIRARVKSREFAPAGVADEAWFRDLHFVAVWSTDARIIITPIVDGRRRLEARRTIELRGDGRSQERKRFELALYESFELEGQEVGRKGLRGTWFQIEVEIIDLWGCARIEAEGWELTFSPATDSIRERTYAVEEWERVELESSERSIWAAGPSLLEYGFGGSDAGVPVRRVIGTREWAPAGPAGECVFLNLFLPLVKATPEELEVEVLVRIDGELLDLPPLILPATEDPTRMVRKVALFRPQLLGGEEIGRHAPRGTWFSVELRTARPAEGEIQWAEGEDGVVLEFATVTESEKPVGGSDAG